MEVFIFREIAPKLVTLLKECFNRITAVSVIDASVVRKPEDYAFVAIMSTALQARLGADVVSDAEYLIKLLQNRGVYEEMMAEVMKVIWSYAKATTVPKVSAVTMEESISYTG